MDGIIAAPITAPGGAVALIRIDGAGAWKFAANLVTKSPSPKRNRSFHVQYPWGEDGLLTFFAAGHSFTGNESAELSVHGSVLSIGHLMQAALNEGARAAEPGEFTLRAFMNGRIDLVHAEGIRQMVEAKTDAQLRLANSLCKGHLTQAVTRMRSDLIRVLTTIEASVDFSEEIGEADSAQLSASLLGTERQIGKILDSARASGLISTGIRIVFAGRPNAGKSSLFNALCGDEKAIVTAMPGTTRDRIEADVQIDGLLCRLIDTAGLRSTEDLVESIGIERARESMRDADLVLYCIDSISEPSPDEITQLRDAGFRIQVVRTKSDLNATSGGIAVSATTGAGLDELKRAITDLVQLDADVTLTLPRHEPLLATARSAILEAINSLESNAPPDLATVHIRAAIRAFGIITGETATPDILHEIFSQFCIGK